jgi:hypothetical protein
MSIKIISGFSDLAFSMASLPSAAVIISQSMVLNIFLRFYKSVGESSTIKTFLMGITKLPPEITLTSSIIDW